MSIYEKLKKKIINNKVLVKNFSSLSVLQVSQFLFPLITFPYLVRVLGPEGYGLVAFAGAFVGYFTIITDYGFNLSATRQISINRENQIEVAKIFCSVLTVKVLLLLASFIIILPIIFCFDKFTEHYEIYLFSFISVIGTTIFPVWFFQGMERMSFISTINIIVKIIWVICVFIFVQSSQDILTLVILNSLSFFVIGIAGIGSIKYFYNIKLRLPSSVDLKTQFVEGWDYFISGLATSLYTTSSIFLLGLFTNNKIVGFYAAGEKIIRVIQSIFEPVFNSLYPHISFLVESSKSAAYKKISNTVKTIFPIFVVISILLFLFAKDIVLIVLGSNFLETVVIIKILAFLPIILALAKIYANLFMLNFNLLKEWKNLILTASSLSVILTFLFVFIFKLEHIGMAISLLLTEIIILVYSRHYFINYKKPNLI